MLTWPALHGFVKIEKFPSTVLGTASTDTALYTYVIMYSVVMICSTMYSRVRLYSCPYRFKYPRVFVPMGFYNYGYT